MPIRILPQRVSAMIAAGEVIERPASVVKELIDNAVDGGATRIEVSVRGAKLQDIVVSDDGVGMGKEDLALCLEHHATSKLPTDDLRDLTTLGFRGEALASMTAVAGVRVVSRPKDQDVALFVQSMNGKTTKPYPCAGGFGTRVEITDLFFNHPARLKFMKSERTERAWAFAAVEKAAVAHPGIEFSFVTPKGRETFKAGGWETRMRRVMADELGPEAVAVEHLTGDSQVHGIVPLPSAVGRPNARQIFVVNGRPVSDRMLSSVVSSVYRTLIGSKETPAAVIWLDVPPHVVDVNCHPQKTEVRFLEPETVADLVRTAVREALDRAGMRSSAAMFDLARRLSAVDGASSLDDRRRLPLGRFMGQADSMWLIGETTDGIVIVDQHAAHERVILERLKAAIHGGGEDMVTVDPPIERELPPMQAAMLAEAMETLLDMGFSMRLSGDTAVMRGYPAVLSGCAPSDLLDLVIVKALIGTAGGVVGEALWETVATAACKAAIKAGDHLDPERADRLLREIEATPNASQCNHGRPTMLFFKSGDLARLFGR